MLFDTHIFAATAECHACFEDCLHFIRKKQSSSVRHRSDQTASTAFRCDAMIFLPEWYLLSTPSKFVVFHLLSHVDATDAEDLLVIFR